MKLGCVDYSYHQYHQGDQVRYSHPVFVVVVVVVVVVVGIIIILLFYFFYPPADGEK